MSRKRILFSLLGITLETTPFNHLPWCSTNTNSFGDMSLVLFTNHFGLLLNIWIYSFTHFFQHLFLIAFRIFNCFLRVIFSSVIGDCQLLAEPNKKWLGVMGSSSFKLILGSVNGLLFTIFSALITNDLNVSMVGIISFSENSRILLTHLIKRSQAPPVCGVPGQLCTHFNVFRTVKDLM